MWVREWTHLDTHIHVRQDCPMVARVKRTYNLAPSTIERVKEMAERYDVAPSQDAVVELAVGELERRLRDERESATWEAAATDGAFREESAELEGTFRSADAETWPD